MSEVNFHYAYLLGNFTNENDNTFFEEDIVVKKCFISFMKSIQHCIKNFPTSNHIIGIFYKSYEQQDLFNSVKEFTQNYNTPKIHFKFIDISQQGENGRLLPIQQAFHWLQAEGKQFVFNVQDNYLFLENTIYEMFLISNQIKFTTGFDIIVSPLNFFSLWLTVYGDPKIQKVIECNDTSKWIRYIDLSNSFMTTHKQFSENWDVYFNFFKLDKKQLELNSLNMMMSEKQIFGFIPLHSLSFEIVPNIVDSPNDNWKILWDNIDVTL